MEGSCCWYVTLILPIPLATSFASQVSAFPPCPFQRGVTLRYLLCLPKNGLQDPRPEVQTPLSGHHSLHKHLLSTLC